MREKTIEAALVKRIKTLGGLCEKFVSPNKRGVPDRIILLPLGRVIFVEVKSCGKVPTKLQLRDHARRRELGFEVVVIDSIDAINMFIGEYLNGDLEGR